MLTVKIFGAINVIGTDANTIYWFIYEVMLLLFFIVFVLVYHRGRTEYRPYTHQRFTRLRIAVVIALLFNIIWTLQFIFKNTKIVSSIFGSLSDTIIAIIICIISAHIIRHYFHLHSKRTPRSFGYYLYSWFFMTLIVISAQLLSASFNGQFVKDLYLYCIYVDFVFNVSFFMLLFTFIILFCLWILIQNKRFGDDKESSAWQESSSDITTGGENDTTAQTFLLRLIGQLCGFCAYFGFLVASNMYKIRISKGNADTYDPYLIIVHFICGKLVLLVICLSYLIPRADNWLTVNPNILNALNINTESNRKKKSTFKDPNASDKWDFHAGHSVDTSYRDDDGLVGYDPDKEWDKESNISYTTLMFRKEQLAKQRLAVSTQKSNWLSGLSFFSPSSSYIQNKIHENKQDMLISVPQNDIQKKRRKKRKKKIERIKKSRYSSQGRQREDLIDEPSQSIQSMFSNET